MHNLYAIYRKEMRHYFVSPVAYVCIGVFLLISAFFFNFFLSAVIQQSFQMEMQSMQFGTPPQFDVPGQVMRAFLGLLLYSHSLHHARFSPWASSPKSASAAPWNC